MWSWGCAWNHSREGAQHFWITLENKVINTQFFKANLMSLGWRVAVFLMECDKDPFCGILMSICAPLTALARLFFQTRATASLLFFAEDPINSFFSLTFNKLNWLISRFVCSQGHRKKQSRHWSTANVQGRSISIGWLTTIFNLREISVLLGSLNNKKTIFCFV